jgi:hypothetical protein
MHLHDHPLAGALFERARPAAIIPTGELAVPPNPQVIAKVMAKKAMI